jgi:hypothetical protein
MSALHDGFGSGKGFGPEREKHRIMKVFQVYPGLSLGVSKGFLEL